MKKSISDRLLISSSPHIQNEESTRTIMYTVILFLLPACIFGFLSFGLHSFYVVLAAILTSLATEAVCQIVMKRPVTIDDGSALLTGLLLGMNMPPSVPIHIPVISSIFAIALVKQAFGGLGQNWANPAIAGRVFAFVAWSKEMTTWKPPFFPDGTTAATPLGAIKSALLEGNIHHAHAPLELLQSIPKEILKTDLDYFKLFFGFKGGCIGEVSVFLLLLAGLYLLYRKIITLDIPLSFIATTALIAWVFDGSRYGTGYFTGDPLFHILTGGIVLGALFMATDMVTTPITTKGRIIFGIGCGVITMLVRLLGSFPEGVSLAILFMNMLTPAIDRFVKVKPLGFVKERG